MHVRPRSSSATQGSRRLHREPRLAARARRVVGRQAARPARERAFGMKIPFGRRDDLVVDDAARRRRARDGQEQAARGLHRRSRPRRRPRERRRSSATHASSPVRAAVEQQRKLGEPRRHACRHRVAVACDQRGDERMRRACARARPSRPATPSQVGRRARGRLALESGHDGRSQRLPRRRGHQRHVAASERGLRASKVREQARGHRRAARAIHADERRRDRAARATPRAACRRRACESASAARGARARAALPRFARGGRRRRSPRPPRSSLDRMPTAAAIDEQSPEVLVRRSPASRRASPRSAISRAGAARARRRAAAPCARPQRLNTRGTHRERVVRRPALEKPRGSDRPCRANARTLDAACPFQSRRTIELTFGVTAHAQRRAELRGSGRAAALARAMDSARAARDRACAGAGFSHARRRTARRARAAAVSRAVSWSANSQHRREERAHEVVADARRRAAAMKSKSPAGKP